MVDAMYASRDKQGLYEDPDLAANCEYHEHVDEEECYS